jgi:hypothetical protein
MCLSFHPLSLPCPGRDLHKTLSDNKYVNSDNEILVVEVLRMLAEMVLYGDSKSELLFE